MIVVYVILGLAVAGAVTTQPDAPPAPVEQIGGPGGGAMLLVALVVLAVWLLSRGAHRAHSTPGHDAAAHEGLGHAAVGYGVRGHGRGIRARVYPDGSGWCDTPRRGLTTAESLAITLGGELAAGPSGCESDRARYARDLRRVPRRQRAAVDAEARALARRHIGNAFGQRVARRLERTGRYR